MSLTRIRSRQILQFSEPVTLATDSGVATITDVTNLFILLGTEEVTALNGYAGGNVRVMWQSARKVKNTTGILETLIGSDRYVMAGDISEFIWMNSGYCKEIDYVKATKDKAYFNFEVVATEGQKVFDIGFIPDANAGVLVFVNGINIATKNISTVGSIVTLSEGVHAGDEVRIFELGDVEANFNLGTF